MKEFVICRHAKSDWSTGQPDFYRPLNKRGMRDAPKLGEMLQQFEFVPDLIISSPANRAKTTAEIIHEKTGCVAPIRFEQSIYDQGAGNIIGILQDLPNDLDRVMVFGHNPTLENVIRILLNLGASIKLPTGGMVCIETWSGNWSDIRPETCTMKWFQIPRLLP